MIETTIILRKLVAGEGKVLTNGENFGKEIYLGKNDKADNWKEISEIEYEEITAKNRAEQE